MLSPRLHLSSPHGGCGKTTALDLLACFVPRPLRTENLTPAVLFRLVDRYHPTLLLDEVDTYLPQSEELRGLLNAGHKSGACAYRCEGRHKEVHSFKAFCPAVLSGIGDLPGTLKDRSIRIPLLPAKPGQIADPFDPRKISAEDILARQLARWIDDSRDAVAAADPPLPPAAFNRLADNWRPLFAIAHVAAAHWPALVTDSFNLLAVPSQISACQPVSISAFASENSQLLSCIRQVFNSTRAGRLSSKQLVDTLLAVPDSPWQTAFEGGPITQAWLGRRMTSLGIKPRGFRIGKSNLRGYDLSVLRSFNEGGSVLRPSEISNLKS